MFLSTDSRRPRNHLQGALQNQRACSDAIAGAFWVTSMPRENHPATAIQKWPAADSSMTCSSKVLGKTMKPDSVQVFRVRGSEGWGLNCVGCMGACLAQRKWD